MTKNVTIHYRRLVDRNFHDLDLGVCIENGLEGQIGGVRLRDGDAARITTSSDGLRMCLLTPEQNQNFVFGEIAVFKDGDVPIAEIIPAGSVTLRTIPLDRNEEAVRGSSYFMARGPHIALVHHESSTRFVSEYFQWLFRQPIGHLPPDELVGLQPVINAATGPVALRDIKSLKLRAEVDRLPVGPAHLSSDGRSRTFRKLIERQPLTTGNVRSILRAFGMTDGSLGSMNEADLEDLELELLVKKRENKRVAPIPDHLVKGLLHDGLDRAAEFTTAGARRRGDGIVASYSSEVELSGAYYELNSVRVALWAALGEWAQQGLI